MWFLTIYGICSKVSAILAFNFSIGPRPKWWFGSYTRFLPILYSRGGAKIYVCTYIRNAYKHAIIIAKGFKNSKHVMHFSFHWLFISYLVVIMQWVKNQSKIFFDRFIWPFFHLRTLLLRQFKKCLEISLNLCSFLTVY